LENALLPSMAAARAPGPNTAKPLSRSRSASPATSGTSGPTTTRSARSRSASRTMPSWSSTLAATHAAWRAMPGLPGTATRRVSIVGRHVQRAAIAADRLVDVAGVFVERAEIVGGLGAVPRLTEGAIVGFARLVVPSHAMQQQAEVVPCGGVGRVDGDHTPVG